jgi:hypothetical protein
LLRIGVVLLILIVIFTGTVGLICLIILGLGLG